VAQYDLYRAATGYLVDVQHGLHDPLSTRVMVPLLPAATAPKPSRGLNPVIEVEGEPHLFFPQYLAAVPRRELGRPVGNLAPHRDDITRALDLLLTGF
jgi:toxin CcdB